MGPIVAITITLAAVYTPVGIQGGLTGALFPELAFTLAGAVLVSGIVVLTLSPMMPFYLFSQRELAPAEDQGLIFAVVQTSANATLAANL